MSNYGYITLKVVGKETELVEFLRGCGAIQWCGHTGSSRDIPISCDGDGTGQLKFYMVADDGTETEVPDVPEENWKNGNLSIGE